MGNKCNENEGTFRVGIQIMIPISYLTEYKSFYSAHYWDFEFKLSFVMYLKHQGIFYEKRFKTLMHIILAFMFQKCSFVNEAHQKHTWLLGNVWK